MLCWAAEADEEKSPGLTKFTEHFNNVSQWSVKNYQFNFTAHCISKDLAMYSTWFCFNRTKTLILDRSLDKRGRERVMLYFISIMKVLAA